MAHPYDAVIPLFLANDPDDVCLVGSGVLVLLEAEYFLLTAAHVTDHLDGHHFLFIPGEDRIIQVEGGFAQLGRAAERDEKASSLDVAYYHLERSFVKRLSNCYHPIAKSGIGMLDQALNGDLYSLAGYPTATSIVESRFMRGRILRNDRCCAPRSVLSKAEIPTRNACPDPVQYPSKRDAERSGKEHSQSLWYEWRCHILVATRR